MILILEQKIKIKSSFCPWFLKVYYYYKNKTKLQKSTICSYGNIVNLLAHYVQILQVLN